MSKNNKKFICIFDASHEVTSQEKLIAHMKKCKAPQKQSYQCCKYHPLHWVKFYQLKEHQQNCISMSVLPTQISRYQMTIPFEVDISMVGGNKGKPQEKKSFQNFQQKSMKKKSKKAVGELKEKKVQLWKQPDFSEFLKKKGSKSKNHLESNGNDKEVYFQQNSLCL